MILKNNNDIRYTFDGYTKLFGTLSFSNNTTVSNELLKLLLNNSKYNSESLLNLFYSDSPFVLNINNGVINISGKNDNEILLGIINLLSLKENNYKVPNQIISDKPKTNHREFMLDIARNFFSLNEIKKIVDKMFYNRINYFHLHFSDDQNYAIESKIHPELNTKEYLKQNEIKELINYCKERGIEVIPEFDMPGHLNHLLEIKKDLRCNHSKGNSICFAKKHDYLYELVDEICSLFPCEYYHLGGDELGIKNQCNCPNCKNLIKQNNYSNRKELAAAFINKMSLYIQNKGKKVIVWNDALKYGQINEEVIIQKWFNYPFDKKCLEEYKNGRKVIISSASDLYFDIPYSLIPLKKTYNYIPEISDNTIDSPFGLSSHLWTEVISKDNNLEYNIFPRLEAFGENSWLEYNKLDYKDFLIRLKKELIHLKEKNISYKKIEDVDRFSFYEIYEFLDEKLKFKNYTEFNYVALLKMISDYFFNKGRNNLIKKIK